MVRSIPAPTGRTNIVRTRFRNLRWPDRKGLLKARYWGNPDSAQYGIIAEYLLPVCILIECAVSSRGFQSLFSLQGELPQWFVILILWRQLRIVDLNGSTEALASPLCPFELLIGNRGSVSLCKIVLRPNGCSQVEIGDDRNSRKGVRTEAFVQLDDCRA
jgi:hypothetical protein